MSAPAIHPPIAAPAVSPRPPFAAPLRPTAVLGPPALLLAGSVLATVGAQHLATGDEGRFPLLRIALLSTVLMTAACSLRLFGRARGFLSATIAGAALG